MISRLLWWLLVRWVDGFSVSPAALDELERVIREESAAAGEQA